MGQTKFLLGCGVLVLLLLRCQLTERVAVEKEMKGESLHPTASPEVSRRQANFALAPYTLPVEPLEEELPLATNELACVCPSCSASKACCHQAYDHCTTWCEETTCCVRCHAIERPDWLYVTEEQFDKACLSCGSVVICGVFPAIMRYHLGASCTAVVSSFGACWCMGCVLLGIMIDDKARKKGYCPPEGSCSFAACSVTSWYEKLSCPLAACRRTRNPQS